MRMVINEETGILNRLNKLKYDSTNPHFIQIESIVISIVQIDEVD